MKNSNSIYKNFARFWLSSVFVFLIGCSYSIKEWEKDYKFPENTFISWDSGQQNSGVVFYDLKYGFAITDHAASRYKDLTIRYGKTNIPQVKVGEGLKRVKSQYYLQNEYIGIFALFNQKYKRGD